MPSTQEKKVPASKGPSKPPGKEKMRDRNLLLLTYGALLFHPHTSYTLMLLIFVVAAIVRNVSGTDDPSRRHWCRIIILSLCFICRDLLITCCSGMLLAYCAFGLIVLTALLWALVVIIARNLFDVYDSSFMRY